MGVDGCFKMRGCGMEMVLGIVFCVALRCIALVGIWMIPIEWR